MEQTPWNLETDPEIAAQNAFTTAKRLREEFELKQQTHTLACLAYYDGAPGQEDVLLGFVGFPSADIPASAFNVVASVTDTFTSHVAKNRVKLFPLTSKGRWEDRQKAKQIGRVIEALINDAGLYGQEAVQVAREGCLTGTGVVKVVPDYSNHRVSVERVRSHEIYVDSKDGALSKPWQIAQCYPVDRQALLQRFPDHRELIEAAPSAPVDTTTLNPGVESVSDEVIVHEIWRRPNKRCDDIFSEDAWKPCAEHGGRHMILIDGIALLDEGWPIPRFPFAVFRPKPRLNGFRGRGFVEILRHTQLRLNKMLRRIDGIMDLHSIVTAAVNRESNVNPRQLQNNSYFRIIECDGPPEGSLRFISPNAVPGDYIAQVEKLINWAYQQVGMSELSAAGVKPAGVEAAVAMQTLLDSESIRHTDVYRAWEQFYLDLGACIIDCVRLLAWNDPDYTVLFADDDDLEEIRWKDVDLDESKFRLRLWPTNLLPETPSAKLERATFLLQSGSIDQATFLTLLDFPDIQAVMGDRDANLQNIEKKLQKVASGQYSAPHSRLDLSLALQKGLERYNALEKDGASNDVLKNVAQWVDDVRELIAKAQPPAPAQPPAAPEGAPMPAPPVPTPGMTTPPEGL